MSVARFVLLALASGLALLACQTASKVSTSDLQVTRFTEHLSEEDRPRWLNGRWNYLRSFYQENIEPYFGSSTVDENCEKRSLDQIESHESSEYIFKSARLLTNDAGLPGLCSSEDQTHRMRLIFLVCKQTHRHFDVKRICAKSDECDVPKQQLVSLCSSKGNE